ncbi:MAG: Nucleoid-associated protein YgaU, contains and LysM domain [Candidatus Acidoferrum typicum]|nr:Nucleoid-associated protein YgaU, contains and LysM domain [Candidatus Acidoferrum typicum]
MNNTDHSSRSKQHVHTPVSLRKPLRCGFAVLLCSCLLFGASHCRAQEAQDAAEAPRQERAGKEQSQKQKHVYTEDDLGRAKILTPEDEARFATQRNLAAPANEPPQPSLDASVEVPQLPLGDVARRYRNAKLALQAPTTFHLPFDEPTFAAPVISLPNVAPPRPSFSSARPSLAPARPNVVVAPAITSPAPLRRIDPFTRRSAPVVPPSAAHIAPNAPAAQPRVSHPAPSPELPQSNLSQKIAALKFESPKFSPLAAQPNPAPAAIAPQPTPQPNVATPIAPLSPLATSSSSPMHTITVQPGDSLWKLAQQTLGRGSRWHELLAANPSILDLTHLAAGTKIVVPNETSALKSRKSDTKITVEKGDTLTKVAQSQYRRATAWRCIVQANPEITDPNRIYEGQQLLLPFNCKQ